MKMLRAAALALVFVNLLLFAAAKGYFGRSSSGEPERLANQLTPERIRIVEGEKPDEARAPAGPVPETRSAAATAATPEGGKPAKPGGAAAERGKAEVAVCQRYEPLSRAQAERLVAAVRRENGRIKVHREPLDEPKSFRVFIPTTGNAEETEKRVGELQRADVTDWQLPPAGTEKGGISLGVYRQEAAANTLRDKLRAKGITGVQVIARESPNAKVAVELTGSNDDVASLGPAISAAVQSIAGRPCGED
jgi:hypothetical protein